MSHGVILGQTPALPADVADKNYVNSAISNLNNSLTNTINSAITSLESRLKNYVDNAVAGVGTGDAPVVGNFVLWNSTTTFRFGPYPKKPKLILFFPLELRYLNSLNGSYFFYGAMFDDGEYWRYESNGVGSGNPQYFNGSGNIGDAYQSGSDWYVQCNKSSFMGPDFWDDYNRTTHYVVFF